MSTIIEPSLPSVDARVEFYSGEGAKWPRDWYLHTFAARIVHRTGTLFFGRDWTGNEPSTTLVHPLPAKLDTATRDDEIAWATRLLARHYKPYADRWTEASIAQDPAPLPNSEEWAFAVGLSRQITNELWAAVARYRAVVDLLVSLLERGVLRAALRPFYRGEPRELPSGNWFNEQYHVCQTDEARAAHAELRAWLQLLKKDLPTS